MKILVSTPYTEAPAASKARFTFGCGRIACSCGGCPRRSQRITQQKSTNGARSAGGGYLLSVNLAAAAAACSTPGPIDPAAWADGEFTPPRVAVAFVQDIADARR